MEDNTTATALALAPMWSSIVKSQPLPNPNPETGVFVINNNNNSCNSTKGIAVAVVDANALIEGGNKLTRNADKLVTVPEVMAEGSNGPNLGEWESLKRASVRDGGMSNSNSRILPLQDLNLNVVDDKELEDGLKVGSKNQEGEVEGRVNGVRPRRLLPKKKEVTIEGKKMVVSGIDASQGEFDEDASDWMLAVSQSTHRRFLRRKARCEHYEAMAQEDAEKNRDNYVVKDGKSLENEIKEGENGDESLSTILEQMRLEEEEDTSNGLLLEGNELDISFERLGSSNPELAGASFESNEAEVDDKDEVDMVNEGLDDVEMPSQADESVDASHAQWQRHVQLRVFPGTP
nr:hypothetical protein CFP56_36896 [Quercus suber]